MFSWTHFFCVWIMLQVFPFKAFPTHDALASGILKPAIHQRNKALFAQLVNAELQQQPYYLSPQERALVLSRRLVQIAHHAFRMGFDLSAYHYKENSPYLTFAIIPIWEGKGVIEQDIPLSFLLYIWPPEHIAKKRAPLNKEHPINEDFENCYYASNIHDHPISCALTVMRGSINQERFERVDGYPYKVVRKIGEDVIQPGQLVIDDNTNPFIHRLVCRDAKAWPTISLHGYGASTVGQVEKVFYDSYTEHSYFHVLEDNGVITSRRW